jgi:hypothetical protein
MVFALYRNTKQPKTIFICLFVGLPNVMFTMAELGINCHCRWMFRWHSQQSEIPHSSSLSSVTLIMNPLTIPSMMQSLCQFSSFAFQTCLQYPSLSSRVTEFIASVIRNCNACRKAHCLHCSHEWCISLLPMPTPELNSHI